MGTWIFAFTTAGYRGNFLFFGGGTRDRTADLLHAMQALSQLSYTPESRALWGIRISLSRGCFRFFCVADVFGA